MGCSKSIDYLLEHLKERADKLYAQVGAVKKQVQEAEHDLEQDNAYITVIEKIKAELSEIDRELEESAKSEKKVS